MVCRTPRSCNAVEHFDLDESLPDTPTEWDSSILCWRLEAKREQNWMNFPVKVVSLRVYISLVWISSSSAMKFYSLDFIWRHARRFRKLLCSCNQINTAAQFKLLSLEMKPRAKFPHRSAPTSIKINSSEIKFEDSSRRLALYPIPLPFTEELSIEKKIFNRSFKLTFCLLDLFATLLFAFGVEHFIHR